MAIALRLGPVLAVLILGLAACTNQTVALGEQQVRDLAWRALEPNTSSHNRVNWEFIEVKQVAGHDVAERFEGEPAPGCWQGATIPSSAKINPGSIYWYVQLEPRPATPLPPKRTPSPTEAPNIPEPYVVQAFFLVDAVDGQVVARKLHCVIY